MITRITLKRYRGFERFEAAMAPHAFLVGPNSAGKSTIIEALALAERCLKLARRRKPTIRFVDGGRGCQGFPIPASASRETDDPVRFDFGTTEARVDIEWSSGAVLHMVWPEEDNDDDRPDGRFWLEAPDGRAATQAAAAMLCPALFVVPVITPLDHFEELKSVEYVREKSNTRLASRHFRNQLRLLYTDGGFDAFLDFLHPWLPEISIQDVVFDASSDRMAAFYVERQSRVPKELGWAGDGMQIWLQLLWHIYRAQGAATIVLDEPEVYLHPDLQRRLVRLLEDLGPQIIIASHSSEVVTEALPTSVLWIDRTTRRARRGGAKAFPNSLMASLGSNYNLALVRAMRSRVVVAVEGDDSRSLRALAKGAGAMAIASESELTIVPLRSFSNWANPEPLKWIAHDVVGPSGSLAVLLSGDCRPATFNSTLVAEMRAAGIYAYVWDYRELWNAVLSAKALARAAGTDEFAMRDHLMDAIKDARSEAHRYWTAQQERFGEGGANTTRLFDAQWRLTGRAERLVSVPIVFDRLNAWLDADGYRLLSVASVARSTKVEDLPTEVVASLLAVDEL